VGPLSLLVTAVVVASVAGCAPPELPAAHVVRTTSAAAAPGVAAVPGAGPAVLRGDAVAGFAATLTEGQVRRLQAADGLLPAGADPARPDLTGADPDRRTRPRRAGGSTGSTSAPSRSTAPTARPRPAPA
jgi:hypothetical protein